MACPVPAQDSVAGRLRPVATAEEVPMPFPQTEIPGRLQAHLPTAGSA